MFKRRFAGICLVLFIFLQIDLLAQVSIRIDANELGEPVSTRLYGKFTEHIGTNVYQGAWAQILMNPEFVPGDRWPERPGRDIIGENLSSAQNIFGLGTLVADSRNGFAGYWARKGDIKGSLNQDGNRDIQVIHSGTEGGAVETGIYAPLHRTGNYEITLKGRSNKPTNLKVAVFSNTGNKLGQVSIPLDAEWSVQHVQFSISRRRHTQAAPCILQVAFEPSVEVEMERMLLFPSDHMFGWDPDVIAYYKDARLPLLRFPGGNFVSGYDWKDGVGSLDDRRVIANPAWPIIEWNHVGTDDWIRFCQLTGAEPMICVNAGDGTPEAAAEWVRYCNDPPDTEWGRLRAQNGSPEPYNVRIWELGNELSGPWQIGHTDGEGYAQRYKAFSKALWEVDPDLFLVANGQLRVLQGNANVDRGGQTYWNQQLMEENRDKVKSVSVHNLLGGHLRGGHFDPQVVWYDVLAFADNYMDFVDELIVKPMKQVGVTPKISITELMSHTGGGHRSLPGYRNIGEALVYSAMLNQCIRNGDLFDLVTHSALINHGGGLRKESGVVFADPAYWTGHFYGTQNGTIPVKIEVESPSFSSTGEYVVKREDVPYADAIAMLCPEGVTLTLMIANRHVSEALDASISIEGFEPGRRAALMYIASDELSARNSPEETDIISPETGSARVNAGKMAHTLPPLSLTRIIFTRR